MHEGSKSDHLAGKAHAQKLMFELSILPDPPHDISTKPVIPIKTTLTCPSCKTMFTIHEKTYHRCSSSESKPSAIDGPLDRFFHFYPSFYYDSFAPPATSFRLLRNHLQQRYRWARQSPENYDLWCSYQAALTKEFNLWFGVEDDLEAWQSLCRAVRISPLPTTIVLCRSVGRPIDSFSRATCANAWFRPFAVVMSTSLILLSGDAAVATMSRTSPQLRNWVIIALRAGRSLVKIWWTSWKLERCWSTCSDHLKQLDNGMDNLVLKSINKLAVGIVWKGGMI